MKIIIFLLLISQAITYCSDLPDTPPAQLEGNNLLLFRAIQNGDTDTAQKIIKLIKNINVVDYGGYTALLWAAIYENIEIVKSLLAAKASASKPNLDGDSPLMRAVTFKNEEIITLLIHNGARGEANQMLIKASETNNIDQVKLLLTCRVSLHVRDSSAQSPVLIAAKKKHENLLLFLLEARANVNNIDNNGDTVLMHVCRSGFLKSVKLLLAEKADINSINDKKETALNVATHENNTALVQLLLNNNSNIYTVNCAEKALKKAIINKYQDIITLLVRAQRQQRRVKDLTPLMEAALWDDAKKIAELKPTAADADLQDTYGDTALILAAREGHSKIVKLLLKAGANADIKNNNGWTASTLAAYRKRFAVVNALQKHTNSSTNLKKES